MMEKEPAPSILQLRSSAGLFGADRMVLSLDEGLRQLGMRSRLLSINNYRLDKQSLHENGIRAGQDAVLLPCRGRLDMRTVAALANQIDQCKAQVVHVHDYKSAFYAWLATRGRQAVKRVATLHGWIDSSQALRLYNRLELGLLRRFDRLVVVSGSQVERLSRAGIPSSHIYQIDNGITIDPDTGPTPAGLRAELGLAGASRVFAAVGRLSHEKNLSLLIDAFAPVVAMDPCARLLLAGSGPELDALKARVTQHGLQEAVLFAGTRADMAQVYGLVDCLVLPSLSEGMPLVVLEAMAHGIPVIGSTVGEVPRLLANSGQGKLIAPGDGPALRTALQDTLARPPMRDLAAMQYVSNHHSVDVMARKYLALYQSLQGDGHARKIA